MAQESPEPLSGPAGEDHLRAIIATYRRPLLAYVLRLTQGDLGRAEDVLQETFLRAWHRLELLSPEYGSVHGWLRRVAHNLVVDGYRLRGARPLEVELEEAAEVTVDDNTGAVLDAVVVQQAIGGLWPEHRAALIEVYLHGRTAAEAAVHLGVPVGTVKSRLHYALRAVRATTTDRTLLAG